MGAFKDTSLYLIILFGILLQLILISAETGNSPENTAVNFLKAYYKVDKSMSCYLCDESKTSNGVNLVGQYIQKKQNEAADRGLSVFYLGYKVYNVKTQILDETGTSATIRIVGSIKPPLKSFFTREGYQHIDKTIQVVKKNRTWKVCGNPFSDLV